MAVVMEDDFPPSTSGPFDNEATVVTAAREYRIAFGYRDSLYRISVDCEGTPSSRHFRGGNATAQGEVTVQGHTRKSAFEATYAIAAAGNRPSVVSVGEAMGGSGGQQAIQRGLQDWMDEAARGAGPVGGRTLELDTRRRRPG
jgi:hypothetical protein